MPKIVMIHDAPGELDGEPWRAGLTYEASEAYAAQLYNIGAAYYVGAPSGPGLSQFDAIALASADGQRLPLWAANVGATVGPQAWLPMQMETGYSSQGAAVRINGERYEFAGRIAKSSGTIASNTKVATLTSSMLVGAESKCVCATDTGPVIVTVGTDRSITVGTVTGTPSWVDIGGLVARMPLRAENAVLAPAPTLPVVRIDTGGLPVPAPTDSDINATMTIDPGLSGLPGLGPLSFKFRGHGNSTWQAGPKKPYKVKFNSATSVFGWPTGKKYRLLANWFDQTFVRNEFAFDLARRTTDTWASRTQACEVYVNGEYKGLYQFAEAVEAGSNQLPVSLWESPNAWNSGTWMLEISNYVKASDVQAFITSTSNTRFVWDEPEPDPSTDATQISAITSWFNAFDALLFNDTDWLDPSIGYATKIDMRSFCDWYIVNEVVRNGDSAFISSCKLYLTPDGILHMGPTWDHDLSLGALYLSGLNADNIAWSGYYAEWKTATSAWFTRLFNDPAFCAMLQSRWAAAKQELFASTGVIARIDAVARAVAPAALNDFFRWGRGGDQPARYAGMRQWLADRLGWLSPRLDTPMLVNLCPNPRAVNNTTGYYATPAHGTLSKQGNAARLTFGGTFTSITGGISSPEVTSGIQEGKTYTALVRARTSAARTLRVTLLFRDAASSIILEVYQNMPRQAQAGELVTMVVSAVAPADAVRVRAKALGASNAEPQWQANDWLEMEGVMIFEGLPPPELQYADPGTEPLIWAWTGTAYNSTSRGRPL